ncbi:Sensor protein ZraS [compost metagenome]
MDKRVKSRISLQKKMVILVTCVTILMMSVVVAFDSFSLQESVKKAYVSQISGMTIAINGHYEESRSVANVQQIFDYIQYKNEDVISLTLNNKEGTILASTLRERIGKNVVGPDLRIPSADQTFIDRLPIHNQEIPRVRVVAPLLEDGMVAGAVEVLLNSSEETSLVHQRVSLIITVSVAASLVMIIALWLILRRIVIVPLMALRQAAINVRQGGTHKKLEFLASPEMEEVSLAFNDMVDNLEDRYEQLENALDSLKSTQAKLVQSEKMGALGSLVAGVSHEINTPIGIGVTAASYLEQKTMEFDQLFQLNKMKRSDLEQFLKVVKESSDMLHANLNRASELIRSFKQVSTDQSNEIKRSFGLKEYMEAVIVSLKPTLKKSKLRVVIHCDYQLQIYSYPGALSQIMTNFIMNSITHAYGPDEEGNLMFEVKLEKNSLFLTYSDDGRGMSAEVLDKIFDPFFTTNRGQGGTGLGMNIVYNLVTGSLAGIITAHSEVGRGTLFMIEIPMEEEPQHD